MAVAKMKLVSKIGKLDMLDSVIEACFECGCFQAEKTIDLVSYAKGFSALIEENPYAANLQKLVDIVGASKHELELVGIEDFHMDTGEISEFVSSLASRVGAMQEQRACLLSSIESTAHSIEQLGHFTELDVDLGDVFCSKFIKVRFGRIPKESYQRLASYTRNPYVMFFPCSHDTFYYWGMYVSPLESKDEVDRIFAGLYFERLRIPDASGTPKDALAELQKTRDAGLARLRELDESINAYWNAEYERCMRVYTLLKSLNSKFKLRKNVACYKDSFIFVGWIPKDQTHKLQRLLEHLPSVECTFEDPDKSLPVKPPTQLNNPRPFRRFEFFVNMYGLPQYNEFDPTVFVAITYVLMFGVMFADLGQGIMLSLVGWWMYKYKKMPLGHILIPCGIASALFGLVFGSVFGFEHWLDPMYRLLGFGGKPIDVLESNTAITLLGGAVGIGVVLVIMAMLINIYTSLRQRDPERALFGSNGIAGLIFYSYVMSALVLKLLAGIDILTLPLILLCVTLPLFCMFFREVLGKLVQGRPDWKPESWGEFIMQNFFEVFEFILSYISNTISFVRVGAFVLVHAGMMMVFFTLAGLAGPILSVLIIILGNVIVMALEGLLVGIQVLRLEYYEMFSRFFEGGGRPFEPVSIESSDS